jgi:hypothetical protein
MRTGRVSGGVQEVRGACEGLQKGGAWLIFLRLGAGNVPNPLRDRVPRDVDVEGEIGDRGRCGGTIWTSSVCFCVCVEDVSGQTEKRQPGAVEVCQQKGGDCSWYGIAVGAIR